MYIYIYIYICIYIYIYTPSGCIRGRVRRRHAAGRRAAARPRHVRAVLRLSLICVLFIVVIDVLRLSVLLWRCSAPICAAPTPRWSCAAPFALVD